LSLELQATGHQSSGATNLRTFVLYATEFALAAVEEAQISKIMSAPRQCNVLCFTNNSPLELTVAYIAFS
jgi:hypothetical protein